MLRDNFENEKIRELEQYGVNDATVSHDLTRQLYVARGTYKGQMIEQEATEESTALGRLADAVKSGSGSSPTTSLIPPNAILRRGPITSGDRVDEVDMRTTAKHLGYEYYEWNHDIHPV